MYCRVSCAPVASGVADLSSFLRLQYAVEFHLGHLLAERRDQRDQVLIVRIAGDVGGLVLPPAPYDSHRVGSERRHQIL